MGMGTCRNQQRGGFVDDRREIGVAGDLVRVPRLTPLRQEQEPTRHRQSFNFSYLICVQVLEVHAFDMFKPFLGAS
jgi:hypothetical protein